MGQSVATEEVHHQISFILGDLGDTSRLLQFNFMALPSAVEGAHEALQDALQSHARDVQLYQPIHDHADGSALGTLQTIIGAASLDASLEAFSAAETVCREIDARASTEASLKPWTIEFVWSNGGADDNAFSQGFLAPSDPVLEDRLHESLAELLGDRVYDLFIVPDYVPPSLSFSEALEEVAETLERHGLPGLADRVRKQAPDGHAEPTPKI